MTFQVTTHSHLLSQDELDRIRNTHTLDQFQVYAFFLQEFDTELDFSNKVKYVKSLSHNPAMDDLHYHVLSIHETYCSAKSYLFNIIVFYSNHS